MTAESRAARSAKISAVLKAKGDGPLPTPRCSECRAEITRNSKSGMCGSCAIARYWDSIRAQRADVKCHDCPAVLTPGCRTGRCQTCAQRHRRSLMTPAGRTVHGQRIKEGMARAKEIAIALGLIQLSQSDHGGNTYEEIAAVMKISKEAVRKAEIRALRKLRKFVALREFLPDGDPGGTS